MTDRVNARRQLADARERIVHAMDVLHQNIANLEEDLRGITAQINEARAQESGLRAALESLGPTLPPRNRKAGAAPTGAKPARKLKAAIPAPEGVANPGNGAAERTLAAAIDGGLLPHRAS